MSEIVYRVGMDNRGYVAGLREQREKMRSHVQEVARQQAVADQVTRQHAARQRRIEEQAARNRDRQIRGLIRLGAAAASAYAIGVRAVQAFARENKEAERQVSRLGATWQHAFGGLGQELAGSGIVEYFGRSIAAVDTLRTKFVNFAADWSRIVLGIGNDGSYQRASHVDEARMAERFGAQAGMVLGAQSRAISREDLRGRMSQATNDHVGAARIRAAQRRDEAMLALEQEEAAATVIPIGINREATRRYEERNARIRESFRIRRELLERTLAAEAGREMHEARERVRANTRAVYGDIGQSLGRLGSGFLGKGRALLGIGAQVGRTFMRFGGEREQALTGMRLGAMSDAAERARLRGEERRALLIENQVELERRLLQIKAATLLPAERTEAMERARAYFSERGRLLLKRYDDKARERNPRLPGGRVADAGLDQTTARQILGPEQARQNVALTQIRHAAEAVARTCQDIYRALEGGALGLQ